MNAKLQKLLSDIAKCAGLTVDFPDGAPIRISGYPDDDAPFVLISVDQPDSELIYDILKNIGLVLVQGREFWDKNLPRYLNRPYESEFAGDATYKTRRVLRLTLNSNWRAEFWALAAYCQLGCPKEFSDFFQRHPKKMLWLPLIMYGLLKARLVKALSQCLKPAS
jgi:hypothetical protein